MKRPDIHEILHPDSIAVVGASDDIKRGATRFLNALKQREYKGDLYAVNPSMDSALGIKSYPSLKDIPGKVDHAIIGVPAVFTPSIIKDAVEKGLNSVHLFTSGFVETETEEGIDLQRKINEIAGGKVRIIGPNCLGIYNPKQNIVYDRHQSTIPGDIAFISQSGGMATVFCETGRVEENYCSKLISLGNSSDLQLTDFLEYLSEDEDTKAIGMYLEGLRRDEGRKFIDILRQTTKRKPVLIWKAGQTEAGARAAASHTGSMAGGYSIWQSMARQLGVVLVDSIEEMHDFFKAFRMLRQSPKSKRSCLVTQGGGNCVGFSDLCAKEGIELPELQKESQDDLLEFLPPMGTIRRNPIDLSASGFTRDVIKKALKIISRDKNIDSIIFVLETRFMAKRHERFGQKPEDILANQIANIVSVRDKTSKPIICSVPAPFQNQAAEELRQYLKKGLEKNNIPLFPSAERAIKVLMKHYGYNCFLNGSGPV